MARDDEGIARPCDSQAPWPLTKGQLYVDNRPFRQVSSLDELQSKEKSYAISPDGRTILANFGTINPFETLLELVVRRRCFCPLFEGPVFMQTHGICVEHAAEPGPFCRDNPVSLRENASLSGVPVEKTFCLPGVAGSGCSLIATQVCYTNTHENTLRCTVLDDTKPLLMFDQECLEATSDDAGRTWNLWEETRLRLRSPYTPLPGRNRSCEPANSPQRTDVD